MRRTNKLESGKGRNLPSTLLARYLLNHILSPAPRQSNLFPRLEPIKAGVVTSRIDEARWVGHTAAVVSSSRGIQRSGGDTMENKAMVDRSKVIGELRAMALMADLCGHVERCQAFNEAADLVARTPAEWVR